MKRIWVVAALIVLARPAGAAEPQELLPTGNVAADTAIAAVNLMNRAMKMIEDDANMVVQAANYATKLAEMEQKVQEHRKQLLELDKQLAQQEGDLDANFKTQKTGKSDKEIAALEREYERRKKELAEARKKVNGMPALLADLGRHIGDQAKLLRQVKKASDWADPQTGQGRRRKAFHKRRYIIGDLTNKLAASVSQVKTVLDKGSTLDVKVERAGAFAGEVLAVRNSPPFELTVNGVAATKGAPLPIGDDRTLRVQVKLVDERRKQSRTIKDKSQVTASVISRDYEFEYSLNDKTFSHWTIAEEEYTDWRLEARTARVPGQKITSSGAHPKVKTDVMTITFSPDTAVETFHVSVIGRTRWEMTGKRNGSPATDASDGSGNASLEIRVAPSR